MLQYIIVYTSNVTVLYITLGGLTLLSKVSGAGVTQWCLRRIMRNEDTNSSAMKNEPDAEADFHIPRMTEKAVEKFDKK